MSKGEIETHEHYERECDRRRERDAALTTANCLVATAGLTGEAAIDRTFSLAERVLEFSRRAEAPQPSGG